MRARNRFFAGQQLPALFRRAKSTSDAHPVIWSKQPTMATAFGVARFLGEEASAPSPEPEGSDIVEVYSFNTGMHHGSGSTSVCRHQHIVLVPHAGHPASFHAACAGLLVLLMVLWSSLGHQVARR